MRYILLVKEDHEHTALETDEERRAFVERFWAALDPSPGTAANERRVEFWGRVEDANRLFRLGPPDHRDLQGAYEVWKYVALPEVGAAPEITIRFRRNSDGEFNMGRGALERSGSPTAPTDISLWLKCGQSAETTPQPLRANTL